MITARPDQLDGKGKNNKLFLWKNMQSPFKTFPDYHTGIHQRTLSLSLYIYILIEILGGDALEYLNQNDEFEQAPR